MVGSSSYEGSSESSDGDVEGARRRFRPPLRPWGLPLNASGIARSSNTAPSTTLKSLFARNSAITVAITSSVCLAVIAGVGVGFKSDKQAVLWALV